MTKRIYPELLTINEVCEILRCHPNSLRAWDKNGKLKAVRIGEKRVRRYRKDDVLHLLSNTKKSNQVGYKVLDLFSGCGGLSYGFDQEGYEAVLGIDNWDLSLDTFKRNHPGSNTLVADLSHISPKEVESITGLKPEEVDIIVGGPPCQGFSISGKRNPDDPRNKLYQSFLAFVGYFKPKAFVMENVPNLVSMSQGAVKETIVKELSSLGYNVSYKILLASDFGVPQNRRRVFFVGTLKEEFVFPEPTHGVGEKLLDKVTCWDAISDLPEDDVNDGSRYEIAAKTEYQCNMRRDAIGIYNHETIKHSDKTKEIIALVPDGKNYKSLPIHLQGTRKVNVAWTRFSSKKPSLTIDTGHNHHFHYEFNRVPTARESARLQSFDDGFIFSGSKNQQIKQIGNAVPPVLGSVIAKQLLKYI